MIIVFPQGIGLLGGNVQSQHPSCFPLSRFLPSTIWEFILPGFSHLLYSLINHFLISSFPSLLYFLPPCWLPFPTVADIFRGWHELKSPQRSTCAVWLSVLSHSMMERLAYLWCSSSCFTICLMYARPLEYYQYSTGEQIAVKP